MVTRDGDLDFPTAIHTQAGEWEDITLLGTGHIIMIIITHPMPTVIIHITEVPTGMVTATDIIMDTMTGTTTDQDLTTVMVT